MSYRIKKLNGSEEPFYMGNYDFGLMLHLAEIHGWDTELSRDDKSPVDYYFIGNLKQLAECLKQGVENARIVKTPVEKEKSIVTSEDLKDGTFLEMLRKQKILFREEPDMQEIMSEVGSSLNTQAAIMEFVEWLDGYEGTIYALN